MTAGAIESLRYLRNPLDVLAQQIVAMVALEPWSLGDLAARRAAGGAVRGAARIGAARGARHAGRALPLRGVRRAAGAHHVGPGHRRARGPSGRAAAGRHLRRHHPRPRPVHGHDPGRGRRRGIAGGRAGRGDGLRVAGGRHVPARHLELAGRGHHARPRDRHPRARGAGADAVLEGRVDRAAAGAGPGGGRVRAGDVGAGRRGRAGAGRGGGARRVGGRQPAGLPARAARGHPARAQRPHDPRRAVPRRAGRLAARGALAVRFAGQRPVGAGDRGAACGSGAGWRCTRPRPTTASCCGCPTRSTTRAPRSCRPPRTCCSTRPRSSRSWSPSWAARRCTRPGSGSARRARCCSPAAIRAAASRCGSSGSGPRSCWRWPGSYEQFPVTLEAMRECVQDVYDLPGLRALMGDVRRRKVRVVEVATPAPSPFARSLLFGYVGMFLYEATRRWPSGARQRCRWTPRCWPSCSARRRSASCSIPRCSPRSRQSLQRLAPDRHARDVEGAADLLRFLGD